MSAWPRPYKEDDFRRQDESDDSGFYSQPCAYFASIYHAEDTSCFTSSKLRQSRTICFELCFSDKADLALTFSPEDPLWTSLP